MTLFVKSIKTTNLFDMYTATWDFNTDVSIMIGPNGCGKSTTLGILDSIVRGIKGNFPVDSAEVTLTSGEKLTLDTPKEVVKVFQPMLIASLRECLNNVTYTDKQVSMFTSIVNKAFEVTKKEITLDDTIIWKGFIVTQKGKELTQDCLSYGELYFISLYYSLIFFAKDCLVMIDDLGNSLHIEWQESIINDMMDIAKMNNLQIITVTHSTGILAGNTDNLADLDLDIKDEGKEIELMKGR